MKIDPKTYYDSDYWTGKKTYTHNGVEKAYHGPSLDWEGWNEIQPIIDQLLPSGEVLDIGCGGGGLTARFMPKRKAFGVEISEHAITNCVPAMCGRIAKADITDCPPDLFAFQSFKAHDKRKHDLTKFPKRFANLISTDLMEHIYEEDLDATFDWMVSKTKKMMFLLIATTTGEEFVHKKGEVIPARWELTAVSGHVNVRNWVYWAKFFNRHGVTIRWDLMYRFQAYRDSLKWFKEMMAWGHDCTWFIEV